jgi:hypothetical protein
MKYGKLFLSAALLSVCGTLAYASSLRLAPLKASRGLSDSAHPKQADRVRLQGAQKQQFAGNIAKGEALLRREPNGVKFALKQ